MRQNINSIEEFFNELAKTEGLLYRKIINVDEIIINNSNYNISFIDSKIKLQTLHIINIKDENLTYEFKNCSIDGRIEIKNCSIGKLEFEDIYILKELYIAKGNKNEAETKIGSFSFKNNKERHESPLDSKFHFEDCTFQSFDFFNVNHIGAYFRLINNKIGSENYKSSFTRQSIVNSWICNVYFSNNNFLESTSFFRSIFTQNKDYWDIYYHGTEFYENTFSDVDFENTNFYGFVNFNNCTFTGRLAFPNANNYSIGDISFNECTFNQHSNFESTRAALLSYTFCIFERTISFSGTELNTIHLNRNIFNRTAHFDSLTIKDIKGCDRTTLRTIKQELQKTDNRIDYNRFRSYELQAYYNELKWNKNFKDWFILAATRVVTGFDHSWQKALGFVLTAAFIFFSLFFISENYALSFSWSGIPQYITGYFRFLLVTDFYNPLIQSGREYISNDGWNHIASWFIFILGKIVIAFGIYEMIQAFRKFKA